MTKVEEQVLELTRCAINKDHIASENLRNLTDEEMNNIIKEAKAQAVVGLILPVIFIYNPTFREKYENHMLSTVSHNIQITNEHVRVGTALDKAEIEYVIIKGCASAEYYPNPTYRAMGDIDVLVRPKDFKAACEVLKKLGYISHGETNKHHHCFSCNGKICELHHIISYVTEDGNDLSKLTDDIIISRKKIHTVSGEIFVPSPYYHGLIMLLHVYKHLFVGIGLRHICDWAVFINSDDGQKVYHDLLDAAKSYSISVLFNTITNASKQYLTYSASKTINKVDAELSKEFIKMVMSDGNFGRKYSNQTWTIFLNGSYSDKQSPFKRMYNAVKVNIHCRLPKTRNNKFLFLLGFLSTPFYYGFMYITKKKKLPKIIKNKIVAKEKNQLFSKLSDK